MEVKKSMVQTKEGEEKYMQNPPLKPTQLPFQISSTPTGYSGRSSTMSNFSNLGKYVVYCKYIVLSLSHLFLPIKIEQIERLASSFMH